MIPDYFHYLLTGVIAAEYTNSSTTQLVRLCRKVSWSNARMVDDKKQYVKCFLKKRWRKNSFHDSRQSGSFGGNRVTW